MSPRPWKPKSALCGAAHPSFVEGVGLVRSIQPRMGMKGALASGLAATFCWNPAAAHCEGSVSVVSPTPTKSPAAFWVKHGELIVGSVSPRLKFSVSRVCSKVAPIFML